MPEPTITKLKFLSDYRFNVEFGLEEAPSLIVDEPKPIGEGAGPNSTRLLSAAVGQCLSSSLLFCLRKARIDVKNLETSVKANVVRNEEGRLRVKSLDVQIQLDINSEDKPRIQQCLRIFEDYCTVTSSVRKGVEVNVSVT